MTLFAFDDGRDLSLLPMAARRALDWAGKKVSLEAWQSLGIVTREALVRLGAEPDVNVQLVLTTLTASAAPTSDIEPVPDPPGHSPPPSVREAFGAHGPISDEAWQQLSPLDRYALAKIAVKQRPERLHAAYREIVSSRVLSSHLSDQGGVRMVDVATKPITHRTAVAETVVTMAPATFDRLIARDVPKGDVLTIAQIAGIMATKKTADLIPLCHPLMLTRVEVALIPEAAIHSVRITARTEAHERTGVEMEALTAASIAALTLYDMLKGIDRSMTVGPTRLLSKTGGRSGDFSR